jgi:hypothetical protein
MMILTRLTADPPPSSGECPHQPKRPAFYRRKTGTVNAALAPPARLRKTARCLKLYATRLCEVRRHDRPTRPTPRRRLTGPRDAWLNYRESFSRAKRVAGLRLLDRSGSPDAARVRRAAFVLLLLTLHAFQAGATHLPRTGQTPTTQSTHVSFLKSWEATASAESGAHAQCLLCRLQRSLSAGLKNSAPVAFSPPQDSLLIKSASTGTPRAATPAATPGRAPPRS